MKKTDYIKTSGYIFLTVALLHLTRVIKNSYAQIGNWVVPMWVSVLVVLIAGYLAYTALTKKS